LNFKYVQLRNNIIVDTPILSGRDITVSVVISSEGKVIKLDKNYLIAPIQEQGDL
jgi:hypothetical protein